MLRHSTSYPTTLASSSRQPLASPSSPSTTTSPLGYGNEHFERESEDVDHRSEGGEGRYGAGEGEEEDDGGVEPDRRRRLSGKNNTPSACAGCKKAHLACDANRPCRRCRMLGKPELCVDVPHKKRGRPKGSRSSMGSASPRPTVGSEDRPGYSRTVSSLSTATVSSTTGRSRGSMGSPEQLGIDLGSGFGVPGEEGRGAYASPELGGFGALSFSSGASGHFLDPPAGMSRPADTSYGFSSRHPYRHRTATLPSRIITAAPYPPCVRPGLSSDPHRPSGSSPRSPISPLTLTTLPPFSSFAAGIAEPEPWSPVAMSPQSIFPLSPIPSMGSFASPSGISDPSLPSMDERAMRLLDIQTPDDRYRALPSWETRSSVGLGLQPQPLYIDAQPHRDHRVIEKNGQQVPNQLGLEERELWNRGTRSSQ